MEENTKITPKQTATPKEHILTISNRNNLNISSVEKVVSVKPDLVQLKSSAGDIVITGQNIEVTKLDLEQQILSLYGKFDSIKYIESSKTPLLKKLFK
ncbi:MAG: YabP/YqfC family sporulation protein [Clostridia bacterium]|nr:YabP/YqfC family sporulation protein [Clostridia bacterium]